MGAVNPLVYYVLLFLLHAGLKTQAPTKTAQLLAFPGAEGFGKYTTGGRGGKVYFVDNLNDSGPGSFREAAQAAIPRYIVFRISGTIRLESTVTIRPNATIAGQSAPGDGILIRNYPIRLAGNGNIIMRGLRVRIGNDARMNRPDGNGGDNTDAVAIDLAGGGDILIDHCSFSWGTDGILDIVARRSEINNLSIQNCVIAECLLPHSLALLVMGWKEFDSGPRKVSIRKNFFINNVGRNPRFGNLVIGEVSNNLIYNWRHEATIISDGCSVNITGNYYKAGPDTVLEEAIKIGNDFNCGPTLAYLSENVIERRNGSIHTVDSVLLLGQASVKVLKQPTFSIGNDIPVQEVAEYVINNAGALPKDAVDQRLTDQFYMDIGKIIADEENAGGFPVLKIREAQNDSDSDGMPDWWEHSFGSNPVIADSHYDINKDNYPDIENYLNSFYD